MRYMVLMGTIAMVVNATAATAMSNYKWKKRPLLVFAASETSAALAQQRRILANNRNGLAARDVVIGWVVGSKSSAELGPSPKLTAAALRSRYGVAADDFRAVLVGKDGGVKLSIGMPVESNKLFATIDSMPMRRDEVRKR